MIVTDAKLKLNSSLLDITQVCNFDIDIFHPNLIILKILINDIRSQLYEEYAEPLQLWECKLAIIHCSGHQDDMLIKGIWTNIIDNGIQ